MIMDALLSDLKKRMDGAVAALKTEFSGLRAGRISGDLLAPIHVDAYGSLMPLSQVGSVSVSGTRSLTISVWDKGLISAVEKAIRDSDLGLNPMSDGDVVRINLPELNEDRRKELVKVARKYAENGRVSVRNVRRDGIDTVKKDDASSEDDVRRMSDRIQELTDAAVKEIDVLLTAKEQDIMAV